MVLVESPGKLMGHMKLVENLNLQCRCCDKPSEKYSLALTVAVNGTFSRLKLLLFGRFSHSDLCVMEADSPACEALGGSPKSQDVNGENHV